MSDIHQEWKDLRQKNGEFICHLDGEMAKLEKAERDQTPVEYEDVMIAQRGRIKDLEQKIQYLLRDIEHYVAEKKELNEKLDKAAADYKALWVERDNLMDTISRMEKMIRDLDERNGNLRERLANTNASLKRSVQRESDFQSRIDYLEHLRECQAKEIERLLEIVNAPNGSCSAAVSQEKSALEQKLLDLTTQKDSLVRQNIKLTEDYRRLSNECKNMKSSCDNTWELVSKLNTTNEALKKAIDEMANDAERARQAGHNDGYYKGITELWAAIQAANEKGYEFLAAAYGYSCMADVVRNLSGTAFLRKTDEWQKEIGIGDEVIFGEELLETYDVDLSEERRFIVHDHAEKTCWIAIGKGGTQVIFDEADIVEGLVSKTGRHFDSIPLDYLA